MGHAAVPLHELMRATNMRHVFTVTAGMTHAVKAYHPSHDEHFNRCYCLLGPKNSTFIISPKERRGTISLPPRGSSEA
jgi:hypothetical protein